MRLKNREVYQFAIDIFNSQGYSIAVPNTYNVTNINFGITPNGLYQFIKNKYDNQYPGASIVTGYGAVSSECN
jgi:hypothetical protein